MTAAVEHLDDHRYASDHGGWAVCYCACPCGRTWVGVGPGADEESLSRPWECPGCGAFKGMVVSKEQWDRLRGPPADVVPLRRAHICPRPGCAGKDCPW